jgi:CRP-like cAMP-binding protein
MRAKKLVKDYERALKLEPDNLVLRLKLAAALRDAGRAADSIAMYRSVALAYHQQGRLVQAIAVCRSVLELDPEQAEMRALLGQLDAARTGGSNEDPTKLAEHLHAPTPHRRAAPDDMTPAQVRPGARRDGRPQFPLSRRAPDEDPWSARSLGDGEVSPMGLPATPVDAPVPGALELGDGHRTEPPPGDAARASTPSFHQLHAALVDAFDEPTSEPITHPGAEEPGVELPRAFDRPFAHALANLAPDGSTIEPPLSIFSDLPPAALAELAQRMTLRHVVAGAVVVREGDPGDSCYIVQSGSVRVLKRDARPDVARLGSEHVEVARLGPGALFGEFALLADRRRHASVQALEPSELFEIPRRLLRELAATYPGVGPALERLYRERLVSTLLTSAPFFAPLPLEERSALMARFVPQRVEGGEAIVREGERGGGLYLVVLGSVEITKKREGQRALLLGTLTEGAYFGEISLLRGTVASATVTAAGPVELAQLPPPAFYAVMSTYPILWDEVRREAQRRELMTQNILAGDTNLV